MARIDGTNSSERINGLNSADDIYGYAGNDKIYGYGGDDLIYGGAGNDTIYGGAGDDDIFGGSGINTLWGGSGADWFRMTSRSSGGLSDDYIADFALGADKIDLRAWGVSDFNQVRALLGNTSDGNAILNAFYGGYDHTIEVGDTRSSELVSSDFVYNTSTKALSIGGTNGYGDVLFGGRGADEIDGLGGNDRLLGGLGDDDIYGGSGNDRLFGGAGSDLLSGGAGNDIFVFQATADLTSSSGRDRIVDFELGRDLIDFSRLDADETLSGNQAFEFIGRDTFDDSGQLRYAYSGNDTIIYGNTDNDASAEFSLVLSGRRALLADDFIA